MLFKLDFIEFRHIIFIKRKTYPLDLVNDKYDSITLDTQVEQICLHSNLKRKTRNKRIFEKRENLFLSV